MSSTLTTTQIVSEYGNYYEQAGQNKQRLVRSLVQMPVTLEKHATHRVTTDTIYKMANYEFESVIRPFAKTFSADSSITFHPNEIRLRQIKVDAEIYPNDIENTWLGFLADNNCTPKEWPLVRFIMEEYLRKQIGADRENMIYKAVYDDDGTTPLACLDGIKQLLVNGATAAYPIHVMNGVGALDKDSIFDQIEAFDESLPELYNEEMVCIFVAPKWARLYKKDKRSQNFFFIDDVKQLDGAVDFSKHYVVALPSMAGTDDMWATTKGNLIWCSKRGENIKFEVQAHDRAVHVMCDWWEGIGFACNDMVWCTSETLGEPSATNSGSDTPVIRELYLKTKATETADVAKTTIAAKGLAYGTVPTDATVQIAYGTTASLGSTETATLSSGVYGATLTSLSASTKYYYQFQVVVGNDTYKGEMKDATTLAN